MIRFCDCDFCVHCTDLKNGHAICDAFPDGVPYEHMDKDLEHMKECNNGIGFERREDKNSKND